MDIDPNVKKKLKFFYWSLIYILLCLTLMIALFNPIFKQFVVIPISFQQELWIKDGQKERGLPTNRIRMVDDLMNNHLKNGKRKEEVIALLGKPTDELNIEGRTQELTYIIGNKGVSGVSYLHITFDEQEQINKCKIKKLEF